MRNVRRDSKRAEERECLHWGQPPQDRAPAVVEMSLQIPLLLKCTPVLEAVICCHHLEILMLCHRLPSFILQYSLQNLPAAPRRHEIPTSHLGNRIFLLPWSEGLSPHPQFMPVCPLPPEQPPTCFLFSPPLSPTPTAWETPSPLQTHLNSGDWDFGKGQKGQEGPGEGVWFSSPPHHHEQNYHLASDCPVIIGAWG